VNFTCIGVLHVDEVYFDKHLEIVFLILNQHVNNVELYMLVRWAINHVPRKLEDYSSIFIIHPTELNVFLGGFGPYLNTRCGLI
jgi:hypothetical protein